MWDHPLPPCGGRSGGGHVASDSRRRAPTPNPSLKGGETGGESWATVTRIAWPVAARVLHWSPDQFWTATPAELLGALTPTESHGAPLGRDEFDQLMERDNG
ncbi:phage tail assembly chaperone [Pseudoblastomonas halimionae]|uniref:Phage tail assembly chaperone n=1 Tax=Alteriqipengyuania halimionae TaxID=1926630 RepID=A0A6I4U4I7_9SPHN|nr:phage tail assembly chaperone [Alteriqipengyuania halimionae]MXP11019.1 phage tail assembly chaperone [Alteriqipengyuania halimionae]